MNNINDFSIDANGQVALNADFTKLVGAAALGAYTDFEKEKDASYTPPNLNLGDKDFVFQQRFYGYDNTPWGAGVKERFGLIYQYSGAPDVYLFAFRGTSSPMDMLEDLEAAVATDFSPFHRPEDFPANVEVGLGFYHIYTNTSADMPTSMQQQVFEAIETLPVKPKHIIITGHSLGCSLGTLFALDLAASLPNIGITNMNFASPRVGKASFASAYDDQYQLKNRTVRIRNHYDLVPKVPFTHEPFTYQHVGLQFLVSFSPRSLEHLPSTFVLAWHSVLNYRYVTDKAVDNTPQVWTGDFDDQVSKGVKMISYNPHEHKPKWTFDGFKKHLAEHLAKL